MLKKMLKECQDENKRYASGSIDYPDHYLNDMLKSYNNIKYTASKSKKRKPSKKRAGKITKRRRR